MKNSIFTILLLLFLSFILIGQKEGTITYQETVKLNIKVPEGMEEMFAKMPKERSSLKTLTFKGHESLYMNKEDKIGSDDDSFEMSDGGFQIQLKMEDPDNRTYTNLQDKVTIRQEEFMGKNFLIEGSLEKYNWKIGNDHQKVLDYVCMNALAEIDDSTHIVAWFSPQLPVSFGPANYQGLPGMILALELNQNERIIVATSISLETIDDDKMVSPSKGKKVSMEKFEEIREEKMKEMNARQGGANIHIIGERRKN